MGYFRNRTASNVIFDCGLVIACILVVLSFIRVLSAYSSQPPQASSNLAEAALSVALLSGLITARTWISDRRAKKSSMYMERVKNGWMEAADILNTQVNVRVKWIAAARVIGVCDKLRQKVTEPVDIDSLRVEVDVLREKMWQHFEKSTAFYWGITGTTRRVDSARESERLDDSKAIPLYSIHAIYSLIAYPDDFTDPVDKDRVFTSSDFSGIGNNSGIMDYILTRIKKNE